jgi:type IV pilus assembly protein PilV
MKARMHSFARRRAARGFTLIEVLIALLIFSFGILGAVGMQVRLAQATLQNGDRARASMLADEMASQMWLKHSIDISSVDSAFYTAWRTRVSTPSTSGLPRGQGSVTPDSTGKIARIKITWTPINQTSANSFETSVVIP